MIKVLVVDDDIDLLDMVSLVLSSHNMSVRPLEKCVSFFEQVSTDKPDIVLMDIYLGECDGRNLCKDLKTSSANADIPVILYSAGNITPSSIRESLADDFMSKPFDIHTLVKRINAQLEKHDV